MRIILWVLGAAAILPLVCICAELLTRWWVRARGLYYTRPPGFRLELHPDRKVFPDLEPAVRFEINRDGERGNEPPRRGEPVYRILAAGGSAVECYFLDQMTSWPRALQHLLETQESLRILAVPRVHVGNVSRAGARAEDLDLIFERVLPRYDRLDLIIVMVGASDMFQWLEKGAPQTVPPTPISDIFECHPKGPYRWRVRQLALFELARRLQWCWLRRVVVRKDAGKWIGEARAMRARAKEVRTTFPDPTGMLDHFEHHFRKLLQKARSHADRVLVVPQPWLRKDIYGHHELSRFWQPAMGEPWRQQVTTFYSVEVASELMALLDARAKRVAAELGVEQLDLMAVLEPSLRTYYDLHHFTPEGAANVAAACAAAVLEPLARQRGLSQLLPTLCAPTPGDPVRPGGNDGSRRDGTPRQSLRERASLSRPPSRQGSGGSTRA